MDKYYYLIASLPLLKFDQAPSLSSEDFLAQAEKWLSRQDYVILSSAKINNFLKSPTDTACLSSWKDFDYSIRLQLVFYRRAKKENREYRISKELSSIIQEGRNPLEREKELLRASWDFLEAEELGHFFDLDFLNIYYLKLQILERLASFDKEKGKENFAAYSLVEL